MHVINSALAYYLEVAAPNPPVDHSISHAPYTDNGGCCCAADLQILSRTCCVLVATLLSPIIHRSLSLVHAKPTFITSDVTETRTSLITSMSLRIVLLNVDVSEMCLRNRPRSQCMLSYKIFLFFLFSFTILISCILCWSRAVN